MISAFVRLPRGRPKIASYAVLVAGLAVGFAVEGRAGSGPVPVAVSLYPRGSGRAGRGPRRGRALPSRIAWDHDRARVEPAVHRLAAHCVASTTLGAVKPGMWTTDQAPRPHSRSTG